MCHSIVEGIIMVPYTCCIYYYCKNDMGDVGGAKVIIKDCLYTYICMTTSPITNAMEISI